MDKILIISIGACGAIGSTLFAATLRLNKYRDQFRFLITHNLIDHDNHFQFAYTGWDIKKETINEIIEKNGSISNNNILIEFEDEFKNVNLFYAGHDEISVEEKVQVLENEVNEMLDLYPGFSPVLVNILPSHENTSPNIGVREMMKLKKYPIELPYYILALRKKIPIINFTPNQIETDTIRKLFREEGIPLLGRDGKTGQTFFKTVIATALKNRNLFVEGWYSTNILGNSDGLNLQDEAAAKNKLYNKTQFLYDVLGYNDFQHKVVIDYYKPRKDKKESWDVIDIIGILNEKMSIRINFQGNDSILASAMILDLCIIATRLLAKSQGGECPGVDFFFKNNISNRPMTDYNSQFEKLTKLLFELQ